MSARRKSVMFMILAGALIPVIIGASCPPPQTPQIYSPSTGALTNPVVPTCTAGFVCISVVNTTFIPVEVALYTHDGYDFAPYQYPDPPSYECCTYAYAQNPCNCPRAGAQIGELKLTFPELFQGVNRKDLQGANTKTLVAQGSLQESYQCEQVKSVGVAIARPPNVLTAPEFRAGPNYRQRLAAPASRGPGEIACGGTIQYVIYDDNENADPLFAKLAVRTVLSK